MREFGFCRVVDEDCGNQALLFVQYPYLFRESSGVVIGKCIYIAGPQLQGFRSKVVEGVHFWSVKETYSHGDVRITKDSEMASLCSRYLPSSTMPSQEADVFASGLSRVDLRSVKDIYDPLEIRMRRQSREEVLDDVIRQVQSDLDVPESRIGLTGSLLFCNIEDVGDYDIVLYVDLEEAALTYQAIAGLRDSSRFPTSLGFKPPLQYHDASGRLMCVFHAYKRQSLSPLFQWERIRLDEQISFDGEVSCDKHGLFAPTILTLRGMVEDILILGTACRGFFHTGDIISGTGQKATVYGPHGPRQYVLVRDPWTELTSFP